MNLMRISASRRLTPRIIPRNPPTSATRLLWMRAEHMLKTLPVEKRDLVTAVTAVTALTA